MSEERMVCVFCASGPVPQRYEELAVEVGTALAARGWGVVSGGGRVSMMGCVARAARAGGGHTVGVIPRALFDMEVADGEADELVVTETMRERKALMDEHADAFLALPGGLGTLEELTEAWTASTLGMHRKPVVVLDPDGHYAGLLSWLHEIAESGFMRTTALDRLPIAQTVDQALDLCMGDSATIGTAVRTRADGRAARGGAGVNGSEVNAAEVNGAVVDGAVVDGAAVRESTQ